MNRKAKGTRAEHRTVRLLEAAGYLCLRSAASLGAFDVIGLSATDVVCVQVKHRDWPSAAELERLRAVPLPPNARRLVHRYRDGVRLPDVREVT